MLKEIDELMKSITDNLDTMTPMDVSNNTIKLSGYMSNLAEQLATKETAYYIKWEQIRVVVDTDGRAEHKAKSTSEYYDRRLHELKMKAVVEMIKALKKRSSVLSDESKGVY